MSAALLDVVIPALCCHCGRPGSWWCVECRAEPVAGMRALTIPAGPSVPQVWAGEHAGSLRSALLAHKLSGHRALRTPLVDLLVEAVEPFLPATGRLEVVPVPVRRSSYRRRGVDLVAGLARACARRWSAPGRSVRVRRVLRWRRRVGEQVGNDLAGRRANVAGALAGVADVGRAVIVLDDVSTSGATLAEAVAALRRREPMVRVLAASVSRATPADL